MTDGASGRMIADNGTVVNIADNLGGVAVGKSDIDSYSAKSGRMLDEEGNVVNIADVIGGVETGRTENIDNYSPSSGNLIKEDGTVINVTKALVEKLNGGGGGGATEIGKPFIDTSKMTNFANFISNNNGLLDELDQIDTSNGIEFGNMFYNLNHLKTIPQMDVHKGEGFSSMFHSCSSLLEIPTLDTRNGTTFSSMFYDCYSLTKVPYLDISRGSLFTFMFSGCSALETVSLTTAKKDFKTNTFQGCEALKNITIGEGWAVNIYLNYSNKLTVESLHGMIESLADLTGQTAKTFQIGATNLAKIDEEHIAMLNNKNWNYS